MKREPMGSSESMTLKDNSTECLSTQKTPRQLYYSLLRDQLQSLKRPTYEETNHALLFNKKIVLKYMHTPFKSLGYLQKHLLTTACFNRSDQCRSCKYTRLMHTRQYFVKLCSTSEIKKFLL